MVLRYSLLESSTYDGVVKWPLSHDIIVSVDFDCGGAMACQFDDVELMAVSLPATGDAPFGKIMKFGSVLCM